MIFNRYRDLFEDCAPAFWPWLWLQLYLLLAQKAEDGRERLIMVTWWGYVCVLAVGDAPSDTQDAALDPFQISFTPAFISLRTARFPGDTLAVYLHPVSAPLREIVGKCTAIAKTYFPSLSDKSFVAPPG